jgi:hypothetical protein
MAISDSDLERPPAYGMDESIRIPKTFSIWPWLAFFLLGGAGVLLYDGVHRTMLVGAVKEWGARLWAPAPSSAAADSPPAAPGASSVAAADGGAARAVSGPGGRPSGASTAHPAPVPSGSARSAPRPH